MAIAGLLKKEIQDTKDLAISDFQVKNNRIEKYWPNLYHPNHDYLKPVTMPPPPGRPPNLHGTAAHAAAHFNYVVSQWESLRRIVQICFVGGRSECDPRKGFPITIEKGRLRFFQNLLDWRNQAELLTFVFFAKLFWKILSRPEQQSYAWEKARGLTVQDDFYRVFRAMVTNSPTFLNGMVGGDSKKKWDLLERIVTSPVDLSKRKYRVYKFDF